MIDDHEGEGELIQPRPDQGEQQQREAEAFIEDGAEGLRQNLTRRGEGGFERVARNTVAPLRECPWAFEL